MTVQIREDGIELKIYKQHQTTSGALLNKLPHVSHPHKPHQEAASTTKWRCPPMEHVSAPAFQSLDFGNFQARRSNSQALGRHGAGWEFRANISMGKDER